MGIFDSGLLEQLTDKTWYSPFPQYQTTERPGSCSNGDLEWKDCSSL